MSEVKPVSIKTAEERLKQKYGIDGFMLCDDDDWCNAYEQEVKELRAALEALQAELDLSNTVHELSRGTTKEDMIKKIAFLQNQAEEMLTAMRRAVLALAFAAESSNAMKNDYQALSKAIDKAVSAQKGTE